MLQLANISLLQFRNYVHHSFSFTERVVGICGLNGTGKTNLLDGVYYLSFTKSYFSRPDSSNVYHGLEGFRIEGEYLAGDETQKVICILRENNKKEFSFNNDDYKRFSDHIGKIPCVMIAPDDVELVTGSSEERRKFIDTVLSQLNKQYLDALISYSKILQQRNSILKQAAEQGRVDELLLDIVSAQLAQQGDFIFAQRNQFLENFLPLVYSFYEKISAKTDNINLKYESSLFNGQMKELLASAKQKDFILQRTSAGIHKDDIALSIGNVAFKSEASQGQKKSLLFALKMAEWQTLKDYKGFAPILLLDDVFEKLDEQRMHNLLEWVCTEGDGQVLITDTHKERLIHQFKAINVKYQLIELN